MRTSIILAATFWAVGGVGIGEAPQDAGPQEQRPRSPEEGVKSWRTQPGFSVDLIAAEPHVASPVAMTFDADGRIYVCEMLDFPVVRTPGMFGPFPEGQIRLLETDADGRVKRSTIFARSIPAPCSVIPYDGGILVAAAPDILFLKDTVGDGYAHVRRPLLTGFDTRHDLYRVNSLQWGNDGWIYARGRGDTPIHWGDDPDGPALSTRNMDFRFKPRERKFEALSGLSSCFGLTQDDWGRGFFTNSSSHVHQIVLPNKYLGRNPSLAAPALTSNISDHGDAAPVFRVSEPRAWRVRRSEIWKGDKSKTERFWEIENRQDFMTAVCGPKIYRETAFPAEFRGNYFHCEASCNLIHRDVLRGEGPVFTASRGHEKSEFLASTDPWCSPVSLETGPDGALYVCDMYRYLIDHASDIPLAVLQEYGARAGSTMGRIYRVRHESGPAARKPRLSRAAPEELAATLGDPNAWWRTTAQRLILEHPEKADRAGIERVARSSPHAEARLQALWTLDALGKLEEPLVLEALKDEHPGLRENAIRMAEPRLATAPSLEAALLGMTGDKNRSVRYQLAFSLGEIRSPARTRALRSMARRDAGDSYMRAAILCSVGEVPLDCLRLVLSEPGPDADRFLSDLARLIGTRLDPGEIAEALSVIEKVPSAASLQGLALGIQQRGKREIEIPAARPSLEKLAASPTKDIRRAAGAVSALVRTMTEEERKSAVEKAGREALDETRPIQDRVEAVRTTALGRFRDAEAPLSQLLQARHPEPIQVAAIQALEGHPDPAVPGLLLDRWRGLLPAARAEAIRALLGRKEWILPVLEAVREGRIAAEYVDGSQRAKLRSFPDREIAEKAKAVLQDRSFDPSLLEDVKGSLDLKGDAARGAATFRKRCIVCHQAGGEGVAVGPNLTTVREHSREQILTDIVYPSRSVLPNFVQYVIETKDGQILNGLIVSSGASSLTLRRQGTPDLTILQKDIKNLFSSQISVMPEGLLKDLTLQDIADLLAFVGMIK